MAEAKRQFNMHYAKTHLSSLADEAKAGNPFIIAKAGKPWVKVIPADAPDEPVRRRIGFMKGMFTLPDNFEEIDRQLDKEIEALMLGESEE
jgi:antitoxin (DNA-binding transcriptional repressor) of toxin-antitoxin stability system